MNARAFLTLLCCSALLVAATMGEDSEKKSKKGDDGEAAIRKVIDSYVEAFNDGDAKRVAEHWSEKAVYIHPDTGDKVTGRKAIAKVFAEIFAGDNGPKLRVQVDSIRLVTSDVAIEDGVAFVTSSEGDEERSTYTAVHVKGKGGWKLDSVRETETPGESAAATPYEQLKELEWMLGNWVDASDEVTVEYSANWAKNRSFIVRLFKVSMPDADDLEGTQIIGWDASSKSIRSWVFDSEGGYSEGAWTRKKDGWVIKSSGYGIDGEKTSSTATIKPLDADSFSWSVVGCKMGNDKLPDLDEVRIVRH